MDTKDEAEIIASLRRIGATYEPEDMGLIGLSGSEPGTNPVALMALRYRSTGGPIASTES
jgi:hypothetical protein